MPYGLNITAVLKIKRHRILAGRLLTLPQQRPQPFGQCHLGHFTAGHQQRPLPWFGLSEGNNLEREVQKVY